MFQGQSITICITTLPSNGGTPYSSPYSLPAQGRFMSDLTSACAAPICFIPILLNDFLFHLPPSPLILHSISSGDALIP